MHRELHQSGRQMLLLVDVNQELVRRVAMGMMMGGLPR